MNPTTEPQNSYTSRTSWRVQDSLGAVAPVALGLLLVRVALLLLALGEARVQDAQRLGALLPDDGVPACHRHEQRVWCQALHTGKNVLACQRHGRARTTRYSTRV